MPNRLPYLTRHPVFFSIPIERRVTQNIGYYSIFWVNLKFKVLPDNSPSINIGKNLDMSHSQMLGKVEYGLPAKI